MIVSKHRHTPRTLRSRENRHSSAELWMDGLSVVSPAKTVTVMSLPNSGFKVPVRVNSLWPNPRLLIALHSPNARLETGLRMCPLEKSQGTDRIRCRAVRSLRSGLLEKNREKRACFAHFVGNRGRNSVQFRLRGGARGIRTPVRFLPR